MSFAAAYGPILAALAVATCLAGSTAADEEMGPRDPALDEGGSVEASEGAQVYDNNPEILAGEIAAASGDWDDASAWGGSPPPWFEDPTSVDCDVAPTWCQDMAHLETELSLK